MEAHPRFHAVVFNEEPAISGIDEGSLVTVSISITPHAAFQIGREEMGEDGGFDMSGFQFSSSADLLVGQSAQIRAGTVSPNRGQTTVTRDLVRLWPSEITGQVGNVDRRPEQWQLQPGPNLSVVHWRHASNRHDQRHDDVGDEFRGFLGFSSLTTGSPASVKGLLFKTSPMPTLVTRTMREDRRD